MTDYWFNTQVETGIDDDGETIFATNKYFKYGAHSTAHVFEAQVGYDFGPLAVNWYTNFAGADGVKENGKAYSSYLALSAPFKLGGLDWTVDLGMVPWETTFYNGYTSGFCVSDVSLGAPRISKSQIPSPFRHLQGICQSTDRRSLLRIRIKFLRERI